MQTLSTNPAFLIYCLAASLISLNLMLVWGYSGGARGKTKTTPNTEDAGTVSKGAQIVAADPPEVARVLRAFNNLAANALPFLVLGLLYVLLGATPTMAWILFGGYAGIRVLYTFAYIGGKQPWRTLTFVVAQLLTLALLVQVVRAAVAGMM